MFRPAAIWLFCGGLLGSSLATAAAAASDIPNFAPSADTAWTPIGEQFLPPSSGAGPVLQDAGHPYVNNQDALASGSQTTIQIGDPDNPILQPWAREALRRRNADIGAGKAAQTRFASCWPLGVPAFLISSVLPTYILQTPDKVLMIHMGDHQTRHVYLNRKHSRDLKPSWHGESVGYYQGDTLIVDTIGLNDQTFIDHFRTPHTEKLHVVERFHIIDDGSTLEVDIHVDDPGAFTTPWDAVQRFRRQQRTLPEYACAENPADPFHEVPEAIPQTDKPDF